MPECVAPACFAREFSVVAATHTKVQVQVRETGNWRRKAAGGVALLVVAAAAWYGFSFRRAPVFTEKDTAVLADFVNSTGDSVFDATLRQGLAIQLSQSPFLSLASDDRIQLTLERMGQPSGMHLTPKLAREVCQRTGSTAVLEGSIASLGNQYVLGLRAENCRTGDLLDEEQVQASRKEEVLHALDQAAVQFRTRVGESLASVQRHGMPLAEATTQSLPALKAYSRGWELVYSNQAGAIPFFSQAIEIDPKFVMAHAALGLVYGHTGESSLAAEHTAKAYALRDRTSENERFFISAYYKGRTTGNQEKAEQLCQTWSRAYPRDVTPHAFLSGFIYTGLGKYERAVAEAERVIELDPDADIGYSKAGSGCDPRHSSCLWFQMLGVEAHSSLPHHQNNGGNLPRQGQPCHLWPHPLGH